MGGKALKNVTTRRYEKEEYDIACKEVVKSISDLTDRLRVAVIEAVKLKSSFGDMDILVSKTPMSIAAINKESLEQTFATANRGYGFECIKNGDVYSFNYKDLQVDLIFNDPATYSYAWDYFSFNDQGNLVGRLAHKFGLKHGHNGLVMPVRNGTHVLGEIQVTTRYRDTLEFLGLSTTRFFEGFDTIEDMFDWVSGSKYFHPDIYLFENVNATSRIRDKKRPTYTTFLEWCKSYTGPVHSGFASKMLAREHVYSHFGQRVKQEYVNLCANGALITAAKAKFNGELVHGITGLTEKRLGAFLAHCKGASVMFEPHNLYMASPDVVNAEVARLFSEYVFEE